MTKFWKIVKVIIGIFWVLQLITLIFALIMYFFVMPRMDREYTLISIQNHEMRIQKLEDKLNKPKTESQINAEAEDAYHEQGR